MNERSAPNDTQLSEHTWDLRLVPAAIVSWLAAIVIVAVPSLVNPVLITAVIGLLVVSALAMVVGVDKSTRAAQRRWCGATVAAGCVVTLSAAVTVLPQESGPIIDAAAQQVSVTITAIIEDEGRFRPSYGFGPPEWEHRASIQTVSSRLGAWEVAGTIVIRIPVDQEVTGVKSPAPPTGSQISAKGRVQQAPWTSQIVAVFRPDGNLIVIAQPGPIDATITAVRSGLRESLRAVPVRSASLVAGLAIGDESAQPSDLADQMRVSGLAHLTAVSGGNIAILLGAIILVARLWALPMWVRSVAGAVGVIAYVLVVGPEPSVLRAAGMGTVAVLAIVVGGPRRGLPALAATVVVLLVLAPSLAISLGFALSVAATAGLLVIAPVLRTRLRSWCARMSGGRARPVTEAIADAIALTASAQIATAPLIASLGNGLSLVAIPANLLAAPAVAPVTLLGLLAAVSAPWLPPLGAIFAHLAAPAAGWIAWWAQTLGGLPAATLPWPGGAVGVIWLLVCVGLIGVVVAQGRKHGWPLRTLGVAAMAIIAVVAIRPPDRAGWPPPQWIAVACDVGQGDGVVISVSQSAAIVVDAGPDPDAIDRCLSELGVDHVVALVLTHFHVDHVGGTPGVLRGRRVDNIVVSPLREPPEQADQVDEWGSAADVLVTTTTAGEIRSFGSDVRWRVLWPQRLINAGSMANNASIVLAVEAQGVDLLLLGDVEPEAQVALRSQPLAQSVDVVKVAHHGSRYQDPRLPAWSGGRVALISVGADNGYGHPADETLAAWAAHAGAVYRTDQHGDVAIVRDTNSESGWGVIVRRGGQ